MRFQSTKKNQMDLEMCFGKSIAKCKIVKNNSSKNSQTCEAKEGKFNQKFQLQTLSKGKLIKTPHSGFF